MTFADNTTVNFIRSLQSMRRGSARDWCNSFNGQLPMPHSAEENQFLADLGGTWLNAKVADSFGTRSRANSTNERRTANFTTRSFENWISDHTKGEFYKLNPDGYWTNHNADPISTVCYVNSTVRRDSIKQFLITGKLPEDTEIVLKNLSTSIIILAALLVVLGIMDLPFSDLCKNKGEKQKEEESKQKQKDEEKQKNE